ncbi:hypothetical protein UFOVP25_19 [uncultured Caudovirales phage]|uniref:Uncharacterized protein n=1 Tax=uncultured Caudovirales phage TaxID=2100421 RepID=A0A6J5KLF4_9CAUD|nr:hypothetical protein UFOVP25_19 [uncultured Caudovirales phage]CAB5216930.1 hypothetical protein UFOVP198_26 [uncultured Caudovirales phage]
MNTLYTGSICLSDIDKTKIAKSEKNGKLYLSVDIWVNEQPDNYGNIGSINVRQSKEEREAKEKKTYIGNFKQLEGKPQAGTYLADREIEPLPF